MAGTLGSQQAGLDWTGARGQQGQPLPPNPCTCPCQKASLLFWLAPTFPSLPSCPPPGPHAVWQCGAGKRQLGLGDPAAVLRAGEASAIVAWQHSP